MSLPSCASLAAQKVALRYAITKVRPSQLPVAYFAANLLGSRSDNSWTWPSIGRFNSTVAAAQPVRDIRLYEDAFRRSVENPEDFWAAAAEHLVWEKKWTKVLDDSNSPFTRW
ncbi:hypothetical protein NP493_94g02047 [Ridgeia piscesae]|uniref:Acetyl-coenzyme A synthetase N-terminal domain-containing protein n=1 Tax=Ridgeia piscesae TaxID=27915 RepID=A0AAD9P810_RIDPI|nr:hypothetical protein NP493_94g02047 [Ridgeia piscesae]